MRSFRLPELAGRVIALVVTGMLLPGWRANVARGELLYFKKGGEVQAPASIAGDRVIIDLGGTKYEFLREDFRRILAGFTPEGEWGSRRRISALAGFTARYEAAWWAISNGLLGEAAAELRDLHVIDPKHAPTARMVAALDLLERPAADPELLEFRKALGITSSVARGPHVILLHQQTETEAEEHIALIEQVISGYYLLFAAQGIELKVPEKRLVCAWFADQKDYLAFLHAQDADAFATTKGYYHPTWNAVVEFDALSSEPQQSGHEVARARREELRQFQETVKRLPPRGRLRVTLTGESARTLDRSAALVMIDRLEREVRREELLLGLERRAINEGTAAHEIVHLLAINSGLMPRHDAFPVWLQEGLAMQFELIRGGRWAGISRASDFRLPDWRRIQPPASLEPLVRDSGYGRGYRRNLYAEAWSLVYYLRVQRPSQFLSFLDLLRSPDASLAELAASERWVTAFRRAFGSDMGTIERGWHQYMATVQTPLERHALDPRIPAESANELNTNRDQPQNRSENRRN